MNEDLHVFDDLPAYALDSLEPDEARLVAEHLQGCMICRAELRALQEIAEGLALTAPDARPTPQLKQRLMTRIEDMRPKPVQPTRRPFLQRLLPAAGVIGLLLMLGFAFSSFLLWQRLNTQDVLTGPLGMRAIVLQNTDAAVQASGFVVMGADGGNGVLIVDKLPQLDAQREYQLWLVRDGEHTSAAVFEVDESGYRGMRIEASESLLTYGSVKVTIEPAGGSAQPTGEQVLGGSLFNP
jgi:anti-sigma-K factor RskA